MTLNTITNPHNYIHNQGFFFKMGNPKGHTLTNGLSVPIKNSIYSLLRHHANKLLLHKCIYLEEIIQLS